MLGNMRLRSFLALAACFGWACGDDAMTGPSGSTGSEDGGAGGAEAERLACATDLGCQGTKSCPSCQCDCEPFATLWERSDVGELLWAASDGDETYLLLGTPPHLVHLDADGEPVDDVAEPDLGWVAEADFTRMHVAPDGSLVITGLVAAVDAAELHIERWSTAGEKLFADTFSGRYASTAMADDGTLILATEGGFFTFDAANRFGRVVPVLDENVYPYESFIDERIPAAGPTGTATWVRWTADVWDNGTFIESGELVDNRDRDGAPVGEPILLERPSVNREGCIMALDEQGAATLACLQQGSQHGWLAHTRPGVGLEWEGESPWTLANGVNVLSTVAMPGDVISALATEWQVQIYRYTAAGQSVGAASYTDGSSRLSGAAIVLPAIAGEFYVFLYQYTDEHGVPARGFRDVHRIRVTELLHGSREEGESCGESGDCKSDVCCRMPDTGGTCGAADGCPAGAGCATSADCGADAECTLALGLPGPGTCWSPCTGDCDRGFVCAAPPGATERLCLPDCLAEGDGVCVAFQDHACTELTDAAGFEVRACVGQP